VALVERLSGDLAQRGCRVQVQHRDMRR